MDSLFGEGTSLPVRFFIAFVVVFALIGLTAWLIRRFGSGGLGSQKARGRAPRLAVIEAGAVDGRRKLVLIRRDNVEHLVMIGGPTDILVEANIVRGQSSSRASAVADNLTRALAGDDDNWPTLQPNAAPRPEPAAPRAAPVASRTAPIEDASQWALQPDQSPLAPALPKRQRAVDPLAGLADELSIQPAPAPLLRPAPVVEGPAADAPRAAAPQPAEPNLSDMAQRLEAALRRPAAPAAPAPLKAEAPRAAPQVTPPAPPIAPPKAPEIRPQPAIAPERAKAAPAPASQGAAKPAAAPATAPTPVAAEKPKKADDMFGSLEEEMASLLGRPTGKPS